MTLQVLPYDYTICKIKELSQFDLSREIFFIVLLSFPLDFRALPSGGTGGRPYTVEDGKRAGMVSINSK